MHIALTLFDGAGITAVSTLPKREAIPTHAFTIPRDVSPLFEIIIAGKAESYTDAIRFIHARNKISFKISGLRFSHSKPPCAEAKSDSFSSSFFGSSGMRIKISVRNATAKVIRSTAITESIPARVKSAVAITGVKIVFSD